MKSDWEMWTAATCEAPTRRLFVSALAYWLDNTGSDRLLTDLYLTLHRGKLVHPISCLDSSKVKFHAGESPQSSDVIEFCARPVQGGLYSLLALVAAGIKTGKTRLVFV